jgi:hypothetical protein
VTLRLRYLTFEVVEFALRDDDGERVVSVVVGSGQTWAKAVIFPHSRSDSGETTGDADLDAAIRERAAEELVRLQAAVQALREGTCGS